MSLAYETSEETVSPFRYVDKSWQAMGELEPYYIPSCGYKPHVLQTFELIAYSSLWLALQVPPLPLRSQSPTFLLNKLRAKVRIFNTTIRKRPLRLVRLCFIEKQMVKRMSFISPETKLSVSQTESLETGSCQGGFSSNRGLSSTHTPMELGLIKFNVIKRL